MKFILPALLTITLTSCLSVARLSSFPQSSDEVDFEGLSATYVERLEPEWTSNTTNEDYFERKIVIPEDKLIEIIRKALEDNHYEIHSINPANDNIFGKRGLVTNEWNSFTGVYYRIDTNNQKVQIYTLTKITQDFTGGWAENRAKRIGFAIEDLLDAGLQLNNQ